jgi:hypothetical protein
MRPRGLYVVEINTLYVGNSVVNVKLSTIHSCVNDKLIEKAKVLAKEFQLKQFAIVYVNINNIVRLLYKFE